MLKFSELNIYKSSKQQIWDVVVFTAICLNPFLVFYEGPIGTIFVVFPMTLYVFSQIISGRVLKFDYLFLFIAWSFLGVFLHSKNNSTALNNTFVLYISLLTLQLLNFTEQKNVFIKIYKMFAWFCVIAIYCQFIAFYAIGYNLTFSIPFLKVNTTFSQGIFQYLSHYDASIIGVRFFGPLNEPSAYCQYVAPLLVLTLFDKNILSKKKIRNAVLISFSLFITFSSMGIILTTVAWICFVFFSKKLTLKTFLLSICGAFLIATVLIVANNEIPAFQKQVSWIGNDDKAKTGARLYRGLDYFKQASLFDKISGVGYMNGSNWGQNEGIISSYNIIESTKSNISNIEYFNGFSQLLLYFGVVGSFIILLFFCSHFFRSSLSGKIMWLLFFFLIYGSSQLFREIGLMYISLCLMHEKGIEYDSHTDNSLRC